MALIALAAGGALLMVQPEPLRSATLLTGTASVVDGDTIRLAGTRIRLLGLDAPELAQTCHDAAGAEWACGSAAFRRLSELVAGARVECRQEGLDRYQRVLAHCMVAGADPAAVLVAEGLAVASSGYHDEEARARQQRRGIWSGDFERPASWRDDAKLDGFWSWLWRFFG